MPKLDTRQYRVKPGQRVNLKRSPTIAKPLFSSKEKFSDALAADVDELSSLQTLLYADDRYSLLVIFQAMDAAGKDSVIKHVMSGVNPQGCQVYSFKHPGPEELDHDYLWNPVRRLPERGRIGIFNRSYYEEVLIVKVHPEILAAQNLPQESLAEPDFWQERYQSIVNLERHLHHNGTRILKFFLHVSKDEQRKRFLERLDDPEKNWKFSAGDLEERARWSQYQSAYEECLSATSTKHAPWYIVPADHKPQTRLIVSRVILETLRDLNLRYPKLDATKTAELKKFRRVLAGS
ncbi:MAG: ADP-polyphosphate phosphotransferase [Bryobacteraceae bacterium]